MYIRKRYIAVVWTALLITLMLMIITGAVNRERQNVVRDFSANGSAAFSVACSSDGRTVYVGDGDMVMVSKDYGSNWEVVVTRQPQSP